MLPASRSTAAGAFRGRARHTLLIIINAACSPFGEDDTFLIGH